MDSFCPLQIDLKNRECLVIGGGFVAARKIKVMHSYQACITIVSPRINDTIKKMVVAEKINYIADVYRPDYLKNKFIVICATGSLEVNRLASADCHERGILVNTVSEPENCSYFMPAIFRRGMLTVAISTAGSSPALARRIRDELALQVSPDYESYTLFLQKIRQEILIQVEDQKTRRLLFEYLASKDFYNEFKNLSPTDADVRVKELIEACNRGPKGLFSEEGD